MELVVTPDVLLIGLLVADVVFHRDKKWETSFKFKDSIKYAGISSICLHPIPIKAKITIITFRTRRIDNNPVK
ncbi:MAG: hypothetical protein JRJ70_13045 [Deltaproteobacteria bacterium]|nr:hypothetical protein [Deltaproteobacteria bacterium]